jgi:histidinol-phosphate aminotransferase
VIDQPTHIKNIPAYKPGKATVEGWDGPVYKLSSNENPYPPLPSVLDAIAQASSHMQFYPNMASPELTVALAERLGVSEPELAFGCGSVEVAGQLIRAFAGHGDEVIFAWRSFEAYPILVRGAGATPVQVPLTADHRHDLDAMLAAITPATKVIFVCTPNNPTGTAVGHEELRKFLQQVPSHILVVIDEAYVHFQTDPDAARGLDLYREFENVAVLHTFSKAYGLAALRLGYVVAREDVMDGLAKVALPFGVTDIAQAAGVASLAAEPELQKRIDILLTEREKLEQFLATTTWDAPSSQANFVWLATGDDTDSLQAYLMSKGIIGRAFSGVGLRISVGLPEANQALIEALSSYHRVT